MDFEGWIFRGGHVARFQIDGQCVCEVLIENTEPLPERGLVTTLPCAGEKDFEEQFSKRLVYMTSMQTETLSEHLFLSTYKEMIEHARESDAIMSAWTDELGRPNLSLMDMQRYRNEVHLQGYHLRSDCGLATRSPAFFIDWSPLLLLATANELIPLPVDPSTRLLVGILTALGSMACWVITSLSFTTAGKRFGSTSVNVVRSVLAAIFLFFVVKQLSGSFFPFDLSLEILLLSLSGVLGLAVGDQLIFAAFNRAGPRLTLLVLNLVPVATAFLAWPTLGEPLNPFGWIGILLTIIGVAWVVSDQPKDVEKILKVDANYSPRLGITLALMGVISVSIGNVLAKQGMTPSESGDRIGALIAQDVRMLAGAAAIVFMAVIAGACARTIGTPPLPDPSKRPARSLAILTLLLGTALGPILGIILFLYSAALIKLAVTTTIVALTPIAILPFSHLVEHSPVTRKAVFGALLGVAGVVLLTFSEPVSSEDVSAADSTSEVVSSEKLHSMHND
eukprot:gene702-883_t